MPLIKVATQKKQKLGSDSEEEWGGDGVQAHSSSDLEVDVFSAKPKKTVRGKGRAPKGAGAKPAKATMLAVKVMTMQFVVVCVHVHGCTSWCITGALLWFVTVSEQIEYRSSVHVAEMVVILNCLTLIT